MKTWVMCLALLSLASCLDETPGRQEIDVQVFNTGNSVLPDNQVQAIAINGDVKWIGTSRGLVQVAGDDWTTHTESLPSSFITAVVTDNEGNAWVGTDKGLAKFDGASWSVCERFAADFITALTYDALSGCLWIGTDKGLGRYRDNVWERYDDPGSVLMDMYVSSLATGPDGTLWMGSFDHFAFVGRLFRYDGSVWTSYRLDEYNLNSSFPDALVVDAQNVVWMGVKGTMGGMLVRIQGERWDLYDRLNTTGSLVGGVTAINLEDNTKWIASSTGVARFRDTWTQFTKENSGWPEDHILCMAIDSQGNKWLGTLNSGLVLWPV